MTHHCGTEMELRFAGLEVSLYYCPKCQVHVEVEVEKIIKNDNKSTIISIKKGRKS